jgi:hypothetical protein
MSSRIDALEARRQALLNKCEEQRLELAYKVAQVTPRAALTAWSRRAGSKAGGKNPLPWIASAAGLLMMLLRRRRRARGRRFGYDVVGAGNAHDDDFAGVGTGTGAIRNVQGDASAPALNWRQRWQGAQSCARGLRLRPFDSRVGTTIGGFAARARRARWHRRRRRLTASGRLVAPARSARLMPASVRP